MKFQRWEILPHKGIGFLEFGMTRTHVRTLIPSSALPFRKGGSSSTSTDAYNELGLHLHYDIEDHLECIEAWNACVILIRGVVLLGVDIRTVLDALAKVGLAARFDDGYFFDDGGFALYAPNDVVEAVTVYRKGYYEGGQ